MNFLSEIFKILTPILEFITIQLSNIFDSVSDVLYQYFFNMIDEFLEPYGIIGFGKFLFALFQLLSGLAVIFGIVAVLSYFSDSLSRILNGLGDLFRFLK